MCNTVLVLCYILSCHLFSTLKFKSFLSEKFWLFIFSLGCSKFQLSRHCLLVTYYCGRMNTWVPGKSSDQDWLWKPVQYISSWLWKLSSQIFGHASVTEHFLFHTDSIQWYSTLLVGHTQLQSNENFKNQQKWW